MKTLRHTSVYILVLLTFLAGCNPSQPAPQIKTSTPTLSPSRTATTTPRPLHGNASVTGRIIAGYGAHQPMAKLPINVDGLTISTVTDEDGYFTLNNLPNGTWTLRANSLTYSVNIYSPSRTLDLGLIKYPLEKTPDYYSKTVPPVDDLNQLMQAGKHIPFGEAIYYANGRRPSQSEQIRNVWLKDIYKELPESFLNWWFSQPAVVYDTIDILEQNNTQTYASDPQFSEWRDLLGIWEIKLADDWHYWEGDYRDQFFYSPTESMNDILDGKMIEVWLIGYKAFDAIKSGNHYFLEVHRGAKFNAIRLPGNGGEPYQIHLIEDGQEVARLPRFCRKPGDPDCAQQQPLDLPFYPSPTPTLLPYTPEPTPHAPALSNLQVINRTNVKDLVPVWRFEPPNNLKENWGSRFAFHPDGKTIAVTVGSHVELINLETGQTIQKYNSDNFPTPYVLKFSPGGKRLAGLTTAGPVLWETSAGKILWKADWSNVEDYQMGVGDFTAMVFSPGGDIIVTTAITYGSNTRIWSAESGKVIKSLDVWNQLDAVFSPNGSLLYTVDRLENYIRAWDTKTWEEVSFPNPPGYPITLSLSPNGKMFAVNSGWNGDGEELTELYLLDGWKNLGRLGQPDAFGAIEMGPTRIEPSFNSDGGILAIAMAQDYGRPNHIELYDTSAIKYICRLDGPFPTPIDQIAFSPDGRLFAARSDNGTTIFWGVPAK